MYPESEILFPPRCIPPMRSLRGPAWADLVDRVKAGDVMREFAARVGGKGGGRPDMAQGGGTDVSALKPALSELASWVADRLT